MTYRIERRDEAPEWDYVDPPEEQDEPPAHQDDETLDLWRDAA
jgi:hypothetical protein